MNDGTFGIRLATSSDVAAIAALIEASVRALSTGYLTEQQIESELRYVISPDTQLIADGTYFVAETDAGALAGAGGWSRRRLLHGGDVYKAHAAARVEAQGYGAHHDPHASDPNGVLDPGTEPARIRAMFTHPAWARRGVARRIFEHACAAASAEGFRDLILTATMPGVPLYTALGFHVIREYQDPMPNGDVVPVVEMGRSIRLEGQEGT